MVDLPPPTGNDKAVVVPLNHHPEENKQPNSIKLAFFQVYPFDLMLWGEMRWGAMRRIKEKLFLPSEKAQFSSFLLLNFHFIRFHVVKDYSEEFDRDVRHKLPRISRLLALSEIDNTTLSTWYDWWGYMVGLRRLWIVYWNKNANKKVILKQSF